MNPILETEGIESLSVEECVSLIRRCMHEETQEDAERLLHLSTSQKKRSLQEMKIALKRAGRREYGA